MLFRSQTPKKTSTFDMCLQQLLKIFSGKSVDLYSLQKDNGLEEIDSKIIDLSDKLGSTYPIEAADRRLLRINITSYSLVSKLVELGITDNYLFQDVPDDLWEGLKKTHCYEVVDGVNVFKTDRSKVALWVMDRFGGKMECITKKDMYKGIMVCEWVVVWR